MSIMCDFNVTNQVTQNTGQRVLVFLTPTDASDAEDYNYNAWKILNPSANGGSQPFTFQDSIQLAVQDQVSLSTSSTVEVLPNQSWIVTNEDYQGPVLSMISTPPPSSKLVAVSNQTDPAILLNSIWSINGSPIVSQGGFNLGTTQTFQLNPTLFFMVAIPTRTGFNWRLQEFSGQFKYIIPQGVTSVNVTWSRPSGMPGSDVLVFDPPSAAGF
ncbi:MAG: hypothetical protein ABUT39_03070 [Acidobacteriota bacterium]